jgi:hypothetical protein
LRPPPLAGRTQSGTHSPAAAAETTWSNIAFAVEAYCVSDVAEEFWKKSAAPPVKRKPLSEGRSAESSSSVESKRTGATRAPPASTNLT